MLKPAGIGWRVAAAEQLPELSQAQKTMLFRIVQESITNVVRHAAARHVEVSLRPEGADLVLEVSDDGVGFTPGKIDGGLHFGLAGIRARADSLGARTEIVSTPGAGTRVRVSLQTRGPDTNEDAS
jgi:signal transduction histidine kinase